MTGKIFLGGLTKNGEKRFESGSFFGMLDKDSGLKQSTDRKKRLDLSGPF
jgi:hypothetical protein